MSGPIVRKYGFPNFDQIFGKRELEHGVDEPEAESDAPASDTPAAPEAEGSDKPKRAKGKKKAK